MRIVARHVVGHGAAAPPRVPNAKRLVLTSDTHDLWLGGGTPAGDVLVHAGDFTRTGKPHEALRFCQVLALHRQYKAIIVVAGNHEISFDPRRAEYSAELVDALAKTPRVTYLENDGAVVEGLKFWGSPATPPFFDWGWMRDDDERATIWSDIPADTDVLVTHGPPFGFGDRCAHGGRVGCRALRAKVEELRVPLHVFGHIHEDHGFHANEHTTFANASMCTLRYRPSNPFLVVDVIPAAA